MLLLNRRYCSAGAEETGRRAGGEAHLKRFCPGSSDNNFSLNVAKQATPMFDLKRPSNKCLFKNGVVEKLQMAADRLTEIIGSLAFQYHKTRTR